MLPPDELLELPPDMPLLLPVPALPEVPPVPLGVLLLVAPGVSRDCFVSGPLLHAVKDSARAIMPAVNNSLFVNTLCSLPVDEEKGAFRNVRALRGVPMTPHPGAAKPRAAPHGVLQSLYRKKAEREDSGARAAARNAPPAVGLVDGSVHGKSLAMWPEGVPSTVVRSMCRLCVSSKSPRA